MILGIVDVRRFFCGVARSGLRCAAGRKGPDQSHFRIRILRRDVHSGQAQLGISGLSCDAAITQMVPFYFYY